MKSALRGTDWRSLARTLALLGAASLAVWPGPTAYAEDEGSVLERRVKAAFIFQFLNYVEWPEGAFPQANAPVAIAVAGDDELAGELAQLMATRTAGGRLLLVKRSKAPESLADVHLLFVGRAAIAALPLWAKLARARPVLIITEVAGALNQGSMINFQRIDNRLRFEISLDEIEKHGLKVSSRLLAVAQTVRRTSPQ